MRLTCFSRDLRPHIRREFSGWYLIVFSVEGRVSEALLLFRLSLQHDLRYREPTQFVVTKKKQRNTVYKHRRIVCGLCKRCVSKLHVMNGLWWRSVVLEQLYWSIQKWLLALTSDNGISFDVLLLFSNIYYTCGYVLIMHTFWACRQFLFMLHF